MILSDAHSSPSQKVEGWTGLILWLAALRHTILALQAALSHKHAKR